MIFDEYSARYRAQLQLDAGLQPDRLREIHDESKAVVDQAVAEVDRLSRIIEREVPIRRHLQSLADVAGGARVSIELHRLPQGS